MFEILPKTRVGLADGFASGEKNVACRRAGGDGSGHGKSVVAACIHSSSAKRGDTPYGQGVFAFRGASSECVNQRGGSGKAVGLLQAEPSRIDNMGLSLRRGGKYPENRNEVGNRGGVDCLSFQLSFADRNGILSTADFCSEAGKNRQNGGVSLFRVGRKSLYGNALLR